MSDYVLITDNGADLPWNFLEENDIKLLRMPFFLDDQQKTEEEVPAEEFYRQIRAGSRSKTAQITPEEAKNFIEPYLQEGKDVLYLAFSSGLSGTCNSAMLAAQQLSEKYPGRKVKVVDSLAASLGEGLFVWHANRLRKEGASLDEVAKWAEENQKHVIQWFTVDDLFHLHQGGRVSKTSAIAGSMLGIKPVLHVDNAGKLIAISKVRGRKQSLAALVNKMEASVGSWRNDFFTLGHGDCLEDAQYVAKMVSERFGIENYMINHIGPVIGTHSGPGTIALFLMGETRKA